MTKINKDENGKIKIGKIVINGVNTIVLADLIVESLLKGKDQYDSPPCTN